jgi:hypothetical protein
VRSGVLRKRLDVVEGDEVLEGDGAPQPSSHQPVELVRRQTPVGRRPGRDVLRGLDVAELEIARRDELLAHLLERLRLDGQRALDAIAEGNGNPLKVTYELAEPFRHQ